MSRVKPRQDRRRVNLEVEEQALCNEAGRVNEEQEDSAAKLHRILRGVELGVGPVLEERIEVPDHDGLPSTVSGILLTKMPKLQSGPERVGPSVRNHEYVVPDSGRHPSDELREGTARR